MVSENACALPVVEEYLKTDVPKVEKSYLHNNQNVRLFSYLQF